MQPPSIVVVNKYSSVYSRFWYKIFHISSYLKIACMQVKEVKVLRGPNYWSIKRQKLIQLTLDLEELEFRPTNEIPGFLERLQQLLPSLYEHRCSEGEPGGFFERVRRGSECATTL